MIILPPQIPSELVKEIEHNISSLIVGFFSRIRKKVASAQGETTPGSGVPNSKRPKRLGLNEEV